jgi:hypothetical protein
MMEMQTVRDICASNMIAHFMRARPEVYRIEWSGKDIFIWVDNDIRTAVNYVSSSIMRSDIHHMKQVMEKFMQYPQGWDRAML